MADIKYIEVPLSGWGEWHPLIERGVLPPNIIMMYAPRNEEELEVAKFIVGRSYAYAKGEIEIVNLSYGITYEY